MKLSIGTFSFGNNSELRQIQWIGAPLEALFYDAIRGVTRSHLLILHFFRTQTLQNRNVPNQIQRYVAEYIAAALDETIEPREFLTTPKGRKPSTSLGPVITDSVYFSKALTTSEKPLPLWSNRHGPGAFEHAGKGLLKQVIHQDDDEATRQSARYIQSGGSEAGSYGHKDIPEKGVSRLFEKQRSRESRISEVDAILLNFYSPEYKSTGRGHEKWMTRLNEIYRTPNALD